MKQSYTSVPVLINFFNRPEPLRLVFQAVKEARPAILFLSQDGARNGNINDKENIVKCREIVADIDWECQVFRNYSEENLGCGRRMSSAISWAFEHVDRLMILEDDCVPGKDFFPFCEELLEKYKDDYRVSMISAMNHLGEYMNSDEDSYIFCNSGAIWAWATWKREWDMYDFNMSFMEDKRVLEKIKRSSYPSCYKRDLIAQGIDRFTKLKRGERLTSWTFQYNMIRFLQHQLTIVPNVNLLSNVGLTAESTHAVSSIKQIPKGLQSIFYMQMSTMEFPLKHPKYMCCDDHFDRKVWRKMGMPKHVQIYRKVESICRQFLYGDKRKLWHKFLDKKKTWRLGKRVWM